MPSKPSFCIRALGCKVSRVEAEELASAFLSANWRQTPLAEADVAVLCTCTVTGEAESKNRKMLREMLRECPGRIIVTGCAVSLDPSPYAAIDSRVVCEGDRARIPALAAELLGSAKPFTTTEAYAPLPRVGRTFRTRVSVKVQDGCDNTCSYCIVNKARGPARSLPLERVVRDIDFHVGNGAKEIVLVGIDLGAYRSDGAGLAELLEAILERTEAERVRLSSIEPENVTPDLVDLLVRSDGRVCRHLHMSLQSGSEKVLREMNRRYTAAEYETLVATLRKRIPTIALSTDVIAGFPGETEEDFAATLGLAERCRFMRLHVFRYSPRPGTPAAERADQIPAAVASQRASRLRELGSRLAEKDARWRVGSVERVIVEKTGDGTSESYRKVRFPRRLPAGSSVETRFTGYDPASGMLLGEPIVG